jgi:hypothetical protein
MVGAGRKGRSKESKEWCIEVRHGRLRCIRKTEEQKAQEV